jgi:hypothetical protein
VSEPAQPEGEPALHYSVAVRLRRTVIEEVHVLVPVTDAVVTDDHLDGDKIFAEAIRIGATQPHAWRPEGEPTVEIHPLQTPPPHVAADRA